MLDDVLGPRLKIVFCGTAVGTKSASIGAYYAGPGNKFWPTLYAIGLTPRQLAPREFAMLPEFGLGLTDIVKCRAGNDAVLQQSDFDVAGFRERILLHAPQIVAFNGKKAASVFMSKGTDEIGYGRQLTQIGKSSVFVLPSTSGAASGYWNEAFWHEIGRVVST